MQSLSEIDTTSKRASKAAGFSWGIAEEIGKAIRSLELFGLPGIKNLNLYLSKIEKNHPEKINKIEIDLDLLKSLGLVSLSVKEVKVISSGEISLPVFIKGLKSSPGARKAIEKAGGTIKE